MNTEISYNYRDGNNWKQHSTRNGDFIFKGVLTKEQLRKMRAHMPSSAEIPWEGFTAPDEIFFIPSQVGLPDLNDTNAEVDHCWHSLDEIEEVDEEPTEDITIQEFYEKFMATKWEPYTIGIDHPKAVIIAAVDEAIQIQQALIKAKIENVPDEANENIKGWLAFQASEIGKLEGMKAIRKIIENLK